MAQNSNIEWTDATWNPIRGCTRVSAGCQNCYAERTAMRFSGKGGSYEGLVKMTNGHPQWTGKVRFIPELLKVPLVRKAPTKFFVNSMSDLFHEGLSDEIIQKIFKVMCEAKRHTFQVLTKRPKRMLEFLSRWDSMTRDFGPLWPNVWPQKHIWLGVSCENQATADERIPLLLQTPAAVRWISAEPLLGPINLKFPTQREAHEEAAGMGLDPMFFAISRIDPEQRIGDGIHWIVAGGESGPGARPMHPNWARTLRDQCKAAGVPFFFKQWGQWAPGEMVPDGRSYPTQQYFDGKWKECSDDWATEKDGGSILYRIGKKAAGRLLDGKEYSEYPVQKAEAVA